MGLRKVTPVDIVFFFFFGCLLMNCEHSRSFAPLRDDDVDDRRRELKPLPGLVSWWQADGDATDRVGNNDGILMNGVFFERGYRNDGFWLDGIDDFVEIPETSSFDLASFTIACWIYYDPESTRNEFNSIISKSDGRSANGGFFLTHDDRNLTPGVFGALPGETNNALRFVVYRSQGIMSRTFVSNAFDSAGFFHVAGTFDGSIARLFLNGECVAKGDSIDSVTFNEFNLRIGASYAHDMLNIDDYFDRTIDEVHIFDHALSATEIRQLAGIDE